MRQTVVGGTVAGLVIAALFACAPATRPGDARLPNVVLIIIDTLRADKLETYGFAESTSPALSRLSRTGVQFDQVIAQASWTVPSIGSMLTSRYPRSLGLYVEEVELLPDRFETLAEVLRGHRYTTFGITANPHINAYFNFHQGFDKYVDSTVVFTKSRDLVPAGKVYYKDASLHSARDIFGKTIDFVNRPGEASFPYFLQINVMEVHEHARTSLRRSEYAAMFSSTDNPGYLQMVRQVTDDIGSFIETLRRQSGWDNTLFIITSDHGEGLGDHPGVAFSRIHGKLLYESHVRVPWIMFNANWSPARRRIARPVRLLELMPTVLDYLGIPPPRGMEGVSLLPLINGEAESIELPELFITETYFRGDNKISAIGRGWQYIHNRDRHEGVPELELQALQTIPNGIATDRSADYSGRLEMMRRYVINWETAHRKTPPTLVERDLLDVERRQLEAVGYFN